MRLLKLALSGLFMLTLLGCAADKDLAEPIIPLGEFRLGFSVVVGDNAKMVPPSRRATEEDLENAMKKALDRRFGRFDGAQIYHVAINIDGYSLAVPGIPLVLSPKSVMIVSATVWDDSKGAKINEEPKQITVLERLSGETVIGSGLTQNKATQLVNLSNNAARLVEAWMRENPQWFEKR